MGKIEFEVRLPHPLWRSDLYLRQPQHPLDSELHLGPSEPRLGADDGVVKQEQVTHLPGSVHHLHQRVVSLEVHLRPAEVIQGVPDHCQAVHQIREI